LEEEIEKTNALLTQIKVISEKKDLESKTLKKNNENLVQNREQNQAIIDNLVDQKNNLAARLATAEEKIGDLE
jgi:hypothetical protein